MGALKIKTRQFMRDRKTTLIKTALIKNLYFQLTYEIETLLSAKEVLRLSGRKVTAIRSL